MPEVASQTLDFVGRELNLTLAEARTALENYVEQPDNITLLERCTQELHQVQGVLRVLEIYGAALLAEEMEQVANYLLATATERKSQAESLDALMRAMVQLPSYLERVLAGGRDLALVLLPLLNDLRAVRGSALLSEGTLLLLNLKSDKQAQPVAAAPGEPPLTVEQWARRLRARYQVGLIGWIRGERTEQNLDILAAVAQKLEQIATRQPVFQLWWVIGAVIEALQENGIEGGVSVKRLLGLGDREIRRLYEQGEARYSQQPAVELLNNLLYYVGRAESSGPRVAAVRASFRLSELLPVDESIEQERENLSAPSVKLMQTVAAAIREDLSKVKDVLDIFVRRGAGQPKELAPQVELLRKIGDTLGVLGLGELRGKVQGETERLEKIVAGDVKADEATLVDIAATLIGVEDRLDDGLVGMIRPKADDLSEPDEDIEFQQVQAAVLRECILNLARIKEAITQNVGGTLDAAGLDSWPELMRGMKAGLLMLGKTRAVEVIEGITTQLKRVMQPGGRGLPPGFLDRLADGIVSVEYYMETLQAGRSDPWYMLDNAQSCVQALEQTQTPPVPTVPALDPGTFAKTVQISTVGGTVIDVGDPGATHVGAGGVAVPPTVSPSRTSIVRALQESADPELVKLFIEEAHEELAKIQRHFPAWDQNPMDRESLVTVRRSFHTLKGSGRMVGARDLGEFAWSIENLLNRILDNTLTRTPAILAVLREAVEALPELIAQLEHGTPPRADMAAISGRAHALAAGKQPTTTARAVAEGDGGVAQSGSSGGTATVAVPNLPGAPRPAVGQAGSSGVGGALASADPGSVSATFTYSASTAAGAAATQVLTHPAHGGGAAAGVGAVPGAASSGSAHAAGTPGSGSGFGAGASGMNGAAAGGGAGPNALSSAGAPGSPAAPGTWAQTTAWGQPSAPGSSPTGSTSSSTSGGSSAMTSLAGAERGSPTSAANSGTSQGNSAAGSLGTSTAGSPASSAATSFGTSPAFSPGTSATGPLGTASAGSSVAGSLDGAGAGSAGSSVAASMGGAGAGSAGSSVAASMGGAGVGAAGSSVAGSTGGAGAGSAGSSAHGSMGTAGAGWTGTSATGSLGASGAHSPGASATGSLGTAATTQPGSSGTAGHATGAAGSPSAAGATGSPAPSWLTPSGANSSAASEAASTAGGASLTTSPSGAGSLGTASDASSASVSPTSGSGSGAPPRKASVTPFPLSAAPGSAASGPTASANATKPTASEQPPAPSGSDGQPAGLDDVLREIYARETNTHIATVRAYLEREAGIPEPHVLPEDVYRACHTLSGSSKMAQARHGTRVAEPLDHWLRRVFSSGLGLTQRDLALLSDCMVAMETVASHLDEPTGYFVTHWGLQERIAEADKALDQRITAATAARAAQEAAAAAAEDAMPEDEIETPDDAGDFDPEVAAIFTEEATELIEASEQALSDWRSEPASAEYRLALKRPLHTLKGGARMAGIMAMGDLSHELETLVMQVDNGSVAPDDTLFEVVQASLDELARMRELVANGRRVSPARAMIARIHSLTRPKSAQPAAAAKPTPAPAARAPSAPASTAARASATPGHAGAASPFFSEPKVELAHTELDIDLTELGADAPPLNESSTPAALGLAAGSPEAVPEPDFGAALADAPSLEQEPSAGLAPQEPVPAAGEAEISADVSSVTPLSSESGIEVTEEPAGIEEQPWQTQETASPWHSAETNIPEAQPSPEQAWLKDTSSEPWPAELANEDASELASTSEGSEAANATAFLTAEGETIELSGDTSADEGQEAPSGEVGGTEPPWAAYVEESLPTDTEQADHRADEAAAPTDEQGAPTGSVLGGTDDAGIIVIDESEPLDAIPAVEPPLSEIERLSATGINATLTQLESAAAAAASTPPPIPSAATPAVAKSVSISFERRSEPRASEDGLLPPQPVPPGREPVAPVERQEMARVDAELLDNLLNISGEASIARSRLEQQLGSFDFNLGELSRTVTRLKEQLRSLEIETEAQILHRHEDEGGHRSEFDPLELDRYSSIQQFSRALAETANDVASIQQLLENLAKDTQTLLQQQARTITELQNGLMRTRMVPFQRHVQRLARIVRQAASDTGKRAELIVEGASGELDRQVLERMLPPFEHMLRNAVVHGIEKPEDRVRAGKPESGRIVLELHREGAEVMVRLTDDGAGMNLKAIRAKGQALGLIAPGQVLSDEDAMQLILEPGFSTAGSITQQAGRGVGMDVVATEIKRLGGALHMETKAGEGTVFTIRLPFTLAISHALVVRTGEEFYALPLPTVEGVLRLSKAEVLAHLGRDAAAFDYGGQKYRFQHLATFVHLEPSPLPEQDVTIPVVLVRAGEHSTGLVADELVGSREIVVKSVGPQISSIRGISGATILGDGRIVIILDIGALVRAEWRSRPQAPVVPKEKADKRVFAMVVDDSITVRRVTQRLLERNGMRVLTARDGMDAVALLQDNIPDIILLDIEMPRMDGYEVAAHVRNDPRLKDVPIIMITSRVGEKHRARAIELGVDDYLGKPYQEAQLLEAIAPLVERRRMAIGSHLYAAELG